MRKGHSLGDDPEASSEDDSQAGSEDRGREAGSQGCSQTGDEGRCKASRSRSYTLATSNKDWSARMVASAGTATGWV